MGEWLLLLSSVWYEVGTQVACNPEVVDSVLKKISWEVWCNVRFAARGSWGFSLVQKSSLVLFSKLCHKPGIWMDIRYGILRSDKNSSAPLWKLYKFKLGTDLMANHHRFLFPDHKTSGKTSTIIWVPCLVRNRVSLEKEIQDSQT